MPKTTAQTHTPGPWQVYKDPNPISRYLIAFVEHSPERLLAVMTHGQEVHPDSWEANARLIAAAPDLLEAARQALTAIQNVRLAIHNTSGSVNTPRHYEDLVTPAVRDLQTAIAKAEGRE